MSNYFNELAKVDCSAHVEKKGKFTYLSWPFAVAELAKRHPKAEIDVREWDGVPAVRGPKGWMVQVSVTIEGIRRTQWHPVLDSNNKAIAEPDVFQLNTSIQRATVKAIALHGLGLYIYAGEDLPEGAADEQAAANQAHAPVQVGRPLDGAWEAQGEESQAWLMGVASEVIGRVENDPADAYEYIEGQKLDADEKSALWTRLDSRTRTAIKRVAAKKMEKAA